MGLFHIQEYNFEVCISDLNALLLNVTGRQMVFVFFRLPFFWSKEGKNTQSVLMLCFTQVSSVSSLLEELAVGINLDQKNCS